MYRASYSKNGVDADDADDTAVPRLSKGVACTACCQKNSKSKSHPVRASDER